jgi:hypothetical protein
MAAAEGRKSYKRWEREALEGQKEVIERQKIFLEV